MKEGFIESGSVRLHFIDWGGVGRPLVLLAGLGNTASVVELDAPDHRIFIAREEETVKAIEQFLIE
jgi:hypothetical protein